MNTSFYPVVGREDTNAIFDRLSIEELQAKQPRQFTLFIIAFLAIQQRPLKEGIFAGVGLQNLAASFDAIASIHGRPFAEWSGDRRSPQDSVTDFNHNDKKDTLPVPSRFGGYCNHGAVSFPPWHRPYVLLIEQAIGSVATEVAESIEKSNPGEKGLWIPAAQQLRFPYWDWAEEIVAINGLPPVLKEDTVKIVLLRDGQPVEVPNPLSYYPFVGGKVPDDFVTTPTAAGTAYFAKWTRSYRYADSSPNPPGSDIEALEKKLKESVPSLRAKIVRLFMFHDGEDTAKTWDEFSNHRMQSKGIHDPYVKGSLEGVHDDVHLILGGNGHMGDPDYAGFDPIFFLHHANVDRLFALWEWCYPKYWMVPYYEDDGEHHVFTQDTGTYHQVYSEAVTPGGNLAPFRNAKGSYWTSDQTHFLDPTALKNFYPKYYSYPEFQGIKVDKAASDAKRLEGRTNVMEFYGWNPCTSVRGTHPSFTVPTKPSGIPDGFKMIPNYRPFVVQVQLREHAYGRAYNLHLAFKTPSGTDQHIGSVGVFARVDSSPCEGCAIRRSAGSVVYGIVPITDSMLHNLIGNMPTGSTSASFDDILMHIKSNLKGSLVDSSGQQLAGAEGGDNAVEVPNGKTASAKVTPVEISLASHAVAAHAAHPARLVDVKNHGRIFTRGWAATHQDSQRK